MIGFINLIKPKGMSSAYAVGKVKKILKCPCGHMGTLDPMASGVLPVGIGKASRLFDYMLDKEKIYVARFTFGILTDTLDTTGVIEKQDGAIPTKEQIDIAVKNFIGEIDQVPPNYSAKCIDGKRGYELARKGVEFSLPPKKVKVLDFKCTNKVSDTDYEFVIKCKGGTYIRSLARDLGLSLGTYAVMSSLDRTECGVFNYQNGINVEDLQSAIDIQNKLIKAEDTVNFEKIVLSKDQAQKILNGLYDDLGYADGTYRVYNENSFWGVGISKDGILKIKSYVRK